MAATSLKELGLQLSSKIRLNDGRFLPILGLGTWLAEKDECKNAALHAITLGYRLLDTASCYENEREVGLAVRNCGLPREELFVTGKLWTTDHGRENTRLAFKQTMEKLGLSYVDLYLIHSPTGGKIIETWDTLIELQAQGQIKSIGVSNFNVHHLKRLIEARPSNIPVVNQIELSPFLSRQEVVSFCKTKNIAVQAFSPLTKGQCLNDSQLIQMTQRYNKTAAQVLIRWSIQSGYICLPKSVKNHRIAENCDVFDFELSNEDMTTMNGWDKQLVTDWDVIQSEWVD